jgi:hypothetical protein
MAARRECRLRLWKGEPVSYYMHICIAFLDLSRELRDRIYSEALILPNPITVYLITVNSYKHHSLIERDYFKDNEERMIYEDKYIIVSKAALFKELAFSLLRASKTIAIETVLILYCSNIFHFEGLYI